MHKSIFRPSKKWEIAIKYMLKETRYKLEYTYLLLGHMAL